MTSARRHPLARLSLRWQLVALTALILVLVTVAIGAVTVTVQSQGLLRRVDDQLMAAMEMTLRPDRKTPEGPTRPEGPPGGRFGSLTVVEVAGETTVAQMILDSGESLTLDERQVSEVLQVASDSNVPQDVALSGLGTYRVLGRSVTSAEGAGTVVVGQSLSETRTTTRDLLIIFTLTGLIAVGLASAVVWILVGKALQPLDRLRVTAARIGKTTLTRGAVELPARLEGPRYAAGTEVGDLAESFNQMMDHVERALAHREKSEAKVKRFAADASHELRTPLATVSGYTEFELQNAVTLPPGTVRSLERIGSESARMATIVEDLLLLARLDSGEKTLNRVAPVAQVVADCVLDAQITGPTHEWSVRIAPDAAGVCAGMSEAELHQALANLLANAAVHTPPGTSVTTSVSVRDQWIDISVADDGPGIPAELRGRVFDRFVRGDSARAPIGKSQGKSCSTGLGLSVTKSLVEAAGGTVELDSSTPGARFLVRLPLVEINPSL